jgi:hypothetical protein
MALVSPGIQISVSDQSQYVNSNVGSVPLVVLATAQDKTYNGAPATGTSKANAGKLLSFSSQRDLVTQMGTPTFQLSSTGTPVNGSEVNEYGLLAAHSALGLTNQLYAIRADIDLAELVGTAVRPIGGPANGTFWLDTLNTQWGIDSLNAVTSSFNSVAPLLITDPTQVTLVTVNGTSVSVPLSSVGTIGQYALVFVNPITITGATPNQIRLFYKKGPDSYTGVIASNNWVLVGSPEWQQSLPAIEGTAPNPAIPTSSTVTINSILVTSDGTVTTLGGPNGLVSKINAATIPGVKAAVSSTGHLLLFVTSAAKSNGTIVDGAISIVDGTNSPMYVAGVVTASTSGTATAYCPILFYGTYAETPSFTNGQNGWFATDYTPRPSGSIWWKTSATGNGFSPVISKFNAGLNQWQAEPAPMYASTRNAIYGLDPAGGGTNIANGQLISLYGIRDNTYNGLKFSEEVMSGMSRATGGATTAFTINDSFSVLSTAPGTPNQTTTTITLTGATVADFVSDLLAANIPYVTASLTTVGTTTTITIEHTAGGQIVLSNVTGTPLTNAGFINGEGSGFITDTNLVIINSFLELTPSVKYSASAPYSSPASGTLWYNSNAVDVDIMINNNGWKGYKNGGIDVRGFHLDITDPMGVIVTPTLAPASQTDGTPLVAGDLWLDSGDLVNYPSLYRYNGSTWVAIDNTDHTSQNGIIFADARWDGTGTTDIITGAFPSVAKMLTSDYIDQDAPDYRLYPRGTLLFNMRRSGYNVKKFVPNYFNSISFPNLPTVPGATSSLPQVKNAWVTASGLNSNGVMNSGSRAQRAIIASAMQSAVDSNLDVSSMTYQFNLLVAPGYPELVPNLLALNNSRGDTGFVIGDTPMDLAPNSVDLTNWNNNTNNDWGLSAGFATSSAYLAVYYPAGRTTDLSGNSVVVPASHAALRTYLYNDQVAYPWFAPAGTQRGVVNNIGDIGYINSATGGFIHNSINQGTRDTLFGLKINPITQLPGSGLVVWGQLTRSGSSTARDRVNVVRLENYLRTIFQSIANGYLFEPNDSMTRKSIAAAVSGSLNSILAHRGLYDFLVICDTSNNTSATIANNQLYVDVAIEPERDVEFIYIPIAIYNPGTIAGIQ